MDELVDGIVLEPSASFLAASSINPSLLLLQSVPSSPKESTPSLGFMNGELSTCWPPSVGPSMSASLHRAFLLTPPISLSFSCALSCRMLLSASSTITSGRNLSTFMMPTGVSHVVRGGRLLRDGEKIASRKENAASLPHWKAWGEWSRNALFLWSDFLVANLQLTVWKHILWESNPLNALCHSTAHQASMAPESRLKALGPPLNGSWLTVLLSGAQILESDRPGSKFYVLSFPAVCLWARSFCLSLTVYIGAKILYAFIPSSL